MATPKATATTQRHIDAHGIRVAVFVPGAFYQGIYPGGFTDGLTGIHIPGPKAIMDDKKGNRREVIALTDLPDPIQLPHKKRIIETRNNIRSTKDVPFDRPDDQPTHDGFQLALSTEVIRIVPDEVVEEKYPDAWAKRQDNIVYLTENVKPKRDMRKLLDEAEKDGRLRSMNQKIKSDEARRQAEIDEADRIAQAAADEDEPPPPPPDEEDD